MHSKRKLFIIRLGVNKNEKGEEVSSPIVESYSFDDEQVMLGSMPVDDLAETLEPQERALFLVGPQPDSDESTGRIGSERRFGIRDIRFNRRYGTMLLTLNNKKTLPRLIEPGHLDEFREFGFRPKDDLHITILNYENGRRLLHGLGGNRHLGVVQREAKAIDWSWRPTGVFVPFMGRRRNTNVIKLITLVDCPGSETFYNVLEDNMSGLDLERHPMHITLMRKPGELYHPRNAIIGGIAVSNALRTLDHLVAT